MYYFDSNTTVPLQCVALVVWNDELHCLSKRPCLYDLRQTRYHYNKVSMFKLIKLVKSENENVLIKLSKFKILHLAVGNHYIAGIVES